MTEKLKKCVVWQCKNRFCKKLHDPLKASVPVCEKCGTNCKTISINEEAWIKAFNCAPQLENRVPEKQCEVK